jgi:tRNA-dihydrouridine synthase 3
MAVANNLLQGKNGEWALLKRHPDEDIFGIQIAAGHADVYTRVSEVIENEGIDVDFVDLNLGCPIDVICNFGCGVSPFLFCSDMDYNNECLLTFGIGETYAERK